MALLATPLLLAGCSMSVLEADSTPATTGSIAQQVTVQQPLPPTLAFSDATRIGQAASAVLAQAEGGASEEWVNASTGSSGTLEGLQAAADKANCRQFSTIVTSIGGVHRYSGAICQAGEGPAVVQIDDRNQDDRS
jgi:surface antigen